MAEHIVNIKVVSLDALLPEARVLRKDPDTPFLSIGERPEPYRTLFIAHARLQPVYEQEKVTSPLVVDTPRGRGLVWRWWSDQIGVVLMRRASNGRDLALDEHVTFLTKEEQEHVTIDLTTIVLNPPKW